MKYFDTHAHYYDERFSEELNGSVDELIDALCSETLSCVVNIGTSPETSRLAIEQAKRHEKMYTAVGIHPSDTRFLSDMKAELCEIEKMLLDPASRAVAIGEIDLITTIPTPIGKGRCATLPPKWKWQRGSECPSSFTTGRHTEI